MGEPIHIALAFDDSFWAPAYATMRSVCYSTDRKTDLIFHLLTSGVSPEHQADLDAIASEYGSSVVHHPMENTDILGARIAQLRPAGGGRFHNVVYARLFLQHVLPSSARRAVYLDCDVIVRVPIEQLAEMDMKGHTLAAVQQPERLRHVGGRDLRTNHIFSMAKPYFNSGVILFDLERYRTVDLIGRLNAGLTKEQIAGLYYDQDVMNYAFVDDILELDYSWNFQFPQPVHEALNPRILHYSGDPRPWTLKPKVAFASTYRHTMTNELFYRFWRYRVMRSLQRIFRLR